MTTRMNAPTEIEILQARLLSSAFRVMANPAAAMQWLLSSQHGLGGAVPWEYANKKESIQEVIDLLGRIECGVYS